MSLLFVLVVLTLLGSLTMTQSQNVISQQCITGNSGQERCYALYSDVTATVTWDKASQRCSAVNKTLAVIEGKSDWDTVQELIQRTNILTGYEVWLAGRRSDNNNWKYLKNDNREMLDGSYPSSRYCGRVSRDASGPQSEDCTRRHYAICQYELDKSDSEDSKEDCSAPDSSSSEEDVCLSLVRQDMTWFEARNYCRAKYPGGDLASIRSVDLSAFDESGSKEAGTMYAAAWIGLQRRPWVWSLNNGEKSIVRYYFGQSEGSDRTQESCLFLEHTLRGATYWADQSCDVGMKYYLCQTESAQFVLDPQSPSGREASEGASPTTSNTVYISVGISVLGVASISGVLIFLYVRRRQMIRAKREEDRARAIRQVTDLSQAPSGSDPERPQISYPMPLDAPYPVSGYTNLGPLIPVKPEAGTPDLDQTYAEIHGEGSRSPLPGFNAFNGFNPYSMSVNFAESDKTLPNGNNIERDAVIYGNTSQAREDYGRSDSVNHVVTENGDEYAIPNKTVKDTENTVVDNMSYHSK